MGFPLLRLAWWGSARPPRSYGKSSRRMKRGGWLAAVIRRCVLGAGMALVTTYPWAAERIVNIVAFGDSLTAGYGLAANEAFPAQLQRALIAKGLTVNVVNAGVSGDTTAGGLARLDWSVPDGTDAVILELGANDALRGFDPAVTRKALDTMLRRLQERKIPVLLCGMVAPPIWALNTAAPSTRSIRISPPKPASSCIRSSSPASPPIPSSINVTGSTRLPQGLR